MALNSSQQNKVIQLLGYGGKSIQFGSVIYNKILNDRLNQLPIDTESLVIEYLAMVAALEAQMRAAPARMVATEVCDIKINARELEDLRRERRRVAKEIATLLDIPYIGNGGVNVGACN